MAQAVTWDSVLACFADRKAPEAVIHRLASEWARRYGIKYQPIGRQSPVTAEYWPGRAVGEHLDTLARIVPEMITDQKPRRMGGPLVLVDFGQGRIGQIDGRRRANVWRDMPGMHEVLIVCAY